MAQAPAPHSVEELLRATAIRDVALSPDGERLAIAGRFGDSRDVVAVLDLDRFDQPDGVRKLAIGREGWHTPLWVMWASDKRLLVGLRVGIDSGYLVAGRQVQAIDPDGGNSIELFAGAKFGARRGLDLSRVVDLTPQDPDHVVMAAWNRNTYDLFRVDVRDGRATLMTRGRASTIGWETESGDAALRYDVNRRGTEVRIHGRDADDPEDWSLVARIRREDVLGEWSYAGDAPGAGRIYVRSRRDGADTYDIHLYDLRSKSFGEAVARGPGYDLSRAFSIDGEYAGAVWVADTVTYQLRDPALQSHWNGMDRYFRGQANVRIAGIDRGRRRMLLHVVGPQAPGDHYFYDFAARNLTFIASDRPWLEPERLAQAEVVRSPMRDGTSITSYLTRPNGRSGPLPLVLMPHGGPEMRDQLTFDPLAQAFAAQGWLVLQPNFRGSSGYGRRFAEAGHRQWAIRMQDDLTDALDDLVKRGIADPGRVAIYGASYGGYAALMGAILTPERYRGAVSLAGVSDLRGMIAHVRREDGEDSMTYRYWLKSIGDPKADRAALDAASPLHRASEVGIPVLLMHGSADEVVPVAQSRQLKKVLEKAGKRVTYVEFPNAPHGEWNTKDEIRQIEEAIAFLRPLLD
ncbi:MAG: S9 family peptidase [Steroidobacteraceae bacterium]|nr:S9 family peptidase [Steroidobacteraceae bacterium]